MANTSYWTYTTVNRILRNESYIGNMVQGRKSQRMRGRAKLKKREEWIVVNGTHEGIIDRDIWEKVQELLQCETRRENPVTTKNIFAGILRCGTCHCAMVKKTGTRRDKKETQKSSVFYYCGSYVRSGRNFCTSHSVSQDKLEKTILEDVQQMIKMPEEVSFGNRNAISNHAWFRRLVEIDKTGKLSRENVVEVISGIMVYEEQKVEIAYRLPEEIRDILSDVKKEDAKKREKAGR